MQEKRKDYIGWDAYFMGIAMLSAQRSKDMPWDREGDFMNTKYAYVCHAELNAILNNKGSNLEGATIYVDLFPCNECAKAIIQCGIKEIVYKSDKYNGTDGNIVSKKMLDYCGVTYRKYEESHKEIKLDL